MAKKKRSENTLDEFWVAVVDFFTSERTRFLRGLILGFLVIYVGIASISFFFTGAADQSFLENVSGDRVSPSNWAGAFGAHIADLFINRWFGIPSFFMLFYLGSVSVKWMGISQIKLIKRFLYATAMLLWSSIFLSFIFAGRDSFLIPGGWLGGELTKGLIRNMGNPGLVIFLIVGFLVMAVCLSTKVIPVLQTAFSLTWFRECRKWPTSKLTGWLRAGKRRKNDRGHAGDDAVDDAPVVVAPREKPERPPFVTVTTEKSADDGVEFTITIPSGDDDDVPLHTDDAPLRPPVLPHKPFPEDDNDVFDESSLGEYDPRLDLSNFRFPPVELLKKYDQTQVYDKDEQDENKKRIKQTLGDFGIDIVSINATVGPTLTLFEVKPAVGVRIARIRNLEDDIALRLSALGIRIIAPMPGKGTIGIEVPNRDAQIVSMQSLIASRKFGESKFDLPVALGRTITNDVFMFDLCKAPHLLMAGATGQGKSVGLNAIITSLLYKKHPAEMKLVLVDPKMVEFSIYSQIERHYLAKLPDEDKAIITDCTRVINTLNSLCKEMDDRYGLLTKAHVRNIKEYNEKFVNRRLNPEKGHRYMPYIVVVIDEFGDLIMQAGKEIEMPIARIAQKARAIGIHMIIATQRPSTTIITGNIKANFPTRIAFRVSQMVDSRTILDTPGANKLIGRGDLLYSGGSPEMTRVQCAFVDTPEVESVARFIGQQQGYPMAYELPEYLPEGDERAAAEVDMSNLDPMFEDAARLIVSQQQGSTSLIQRKLSLGYNRAGRLMDQLERAGIVGPSEGSKPRQVLIIDEYSLEQKLASLK